MRLQILEAIGLLKPEETLLLRQKNCTFCPSTYSSIRLSTNADGDSVTLDFS